MNRSDLIARMTERLGGDRAAAVAAVTGVLEEIEAGVARGERVTLNGFGTFDSRARAARTARNPRTGEAVQVEATVVPVFRAATGFRSLVHLPDGAQPQPQPQPQPASVGDGRARTCTTLQVVAAADGKKGRGRQTAEEDGTAGKKAGKKASKKAAGKTGKKAAKAAKRKAGKKSA